MIILYYEVIADFMRDHATSRKPLNTWKTMAENAVWKSFNDIRKTDKDADRFGDCIIFNIGGKKFRLIAGVEYDAGIVTVKHVLTHAQYDRDKWKKDC